MIYHAVYYPVMINGFLGLKPHGDGIEIKPNLPKDWQSLEITRIHLHDLILDIAVTKDTITLKSKGEARLPFFAYLPEGKWKLTQFDADGKKINEISLDVIDGEGFSIQPKDDVTLHFAR